MLGGVLLGGIVGELLGIERRLEGARRPHPAQAVALGALDGLRGLRRRIAAVLRRLADGGGSIQDGLTGDYETLATKAVLDGFASIALARALGWGVGLSAITILVVQGTLTLAPASSTTSWWARRSPC